jgi:hypothetical protein
MTRGGKIYNAQAPVSQSHDRLCPEPVNDSSRYRAEPSNIRRRVRSDVLLADSIPLHGNVPFVIRPAMPHGITHRNNVGQLAKSTPVEANDTRNAAHQTANSGVATACLIK